MSETTTRRRRGSRSASGERLVLTGPGLLYLTVFMAVPLLLVLVYAFFQRGRFGGVVWRFTFDNFGRALDEVYLRVALSTLTRMRRCVEAAK